MPPQFLCLVISIGLSLKAITKLFSAPTMVGWGPGAKLGNTPKLDKSTSMATIVPHDCSLRQLLPVNSVMIWILSTTKANES